MAAPFGGVGAGAAPDEKADGLGKGRQFAGGVHLRVASQDPVDQRGSRARHAHDENRALAGGRAGRLDLGKCGHQGVHDGAVGLRIVPQPCAFDGVARGEVAPIRGVIAHVFVGFREAEVQDRGVNGAFGRRRQSALHGRHRVLLAGLAVQLGKAFQRLGRRGQFCQDRTVVARRVIQVAEKAVHDGALDPDVGLARRRGDGAIVKCERTAVVAGLDAELADRIEHEGHVGRAGGSLVGGGERFRAVPQRQQAFGLLHQALGVMWVDA